MFFLSPAFLFILLLISLQDLKSLHFPYLSGNLHQRISNSRNYWAVNGNLRSVRVEEIPFSLSNFKEQEERPLVKHSKAADEIYAHRDLRKSRSFFHIFKVPCKLNIYKWIFIDKYLNFFDLKFYLK